MSSVAALQVIGGLGLLIVGGELLLRGAVALAKRFGLSHLLIGLTVVAAATSMPELVVTVVTGLQGVPDVGIGNVIGSNIANILLILGTAAVLFPVRTKPTGMMRDSLAVIAATALVIFFAYVGPFTRLQGFMMIGLLAGYIFYTYMREQKRFARDTLEHNNGDVSEAEQIEVPSGCTMAVVLIVLGVAGLGVGSELLIDGSIVVARAAGVSEAVIGLTLIAVGTSLPELATAVVAGFRHHSEVALGNILGSNLFNLLAVLGALAITTPFRVPAQLLHVDVWVMAGSTLLLIPVMMSRWRVGRVEGAAFLALYVGYIAWQFHRMPVASA